MSTETEIKLSLPASMVGLLLQHRLLATSTPQRQRLINTYYDTPDHRLRSERVVVRHRRSGRQLLLSVKTAPFLAGGLAQRSEWEYPVPSGALDFTPVDDRRVLAVLTALQDQLQVVFATRFTRLAWVLEPRPGVRIELALDRGEIEANGQRQRICEVELELLAGPIGELFSLARELQATLPLHPEACSKSERAYLALRRTPMAAVKASAVALEGPMPAIDAFRRVALSCLSQLQANEKGVGTSELPEFVHQARVAMRRLRSAIRLWEPLLPAAFVARYDPLWQSLAMQLGDTRNWDVFIAETLPVVSNCLGSVVDIGRLSRNAAKQCAASRRSARKALRSGEYARLLIDFTDALLALPSPAKQQRLTTFVPRCLDKRARRVTERAAGSLTADAAARHRLRVAFKQLRYALEFFSPILAGPTLTSYHQTTTALQELLGRLNDLAVAAPMVAAALPSNQAAQVQGWLSERSASLLPELQRVLAEFAALPAPWKAAPEPPAVDAQATATAGKGELLPTT